MAAMESDAPQRVMDLFLDALERPAAARAAYLEHECGADQALRQKVEALLRCQTAAPDFLAQPVFALGADLLADEPEGELRAGDLVGDCRIVSLLGIGGMGEVYLADDTALGRPVALKLIQRAAAGAVLAHFRHERRVLAALNHANIARLYGGAVTPQGRGYLVMEYVDGERLDVYCDQRRLPAPARLELFRKICLAVAYAHQNLVIHRDLKPANIRVTPEGEPKLLDFGIAKLLEADPGTGDKEMTVTQMRAMTPGYASPEQLRGEAVNTATDVYSLGVVLYELLCGCRPPGPLARPSAAPLSEAAAAARGTTPSRLRRQLAGDLDNIVLKAMRPDPARRYASASQFSEDLRRRLEGRPVAARKETLRYVGARFVARNKALTAAAALGLLTLIGGIAATSWQARAAQAQRERAERRFEDVRRLAHSLMFEIHDAVQPLAGSTPTRRLIVTRALEYLDRLNQEADSLALRRDLATAYEKIGDVQGNPYVANLGDPDGALASYRKAEGLRQPDAIGAANPPVEARLALGRTYRGLADILEVKGDFQGMARYYHRSFDVFEQLARDRPADLAAADEMARGAEAMGDGLLRMKDSEPERLRWYEQSLAIRRRLSDLAPADPVNRRALATLCLKLGKMYLPDKARAVETMKRGIAIFKTLAQESPDNMAARRGHGLGLYTLADVLCETSDFAEALRYGRESLEIRQAVAAADPNNAQARFDLAAVQALLGNALTGVGRPEAAVEPASTAVRTLEAMTAADPGNALYARNLGILYETLGDVQAARAASDASHWIEARSGYEQARKIFEDQRANGSMRPSDAGKAASLEEKIAACRDSSYRVQ